MIDYRKHFSDQLSGRGLEIGALHRPMLRHDRMTVDIVDRLTAAEMRKHYPELSEYPFCEPNIVDDAQYLYEVTNGVYDFVIASHVIEHMQDPLGALKNWLRVLRSGGLLYLIVPDKRHTFDKRRPLTAISHLVEDYYGILDFDTSKRDWQHYLEYAELVDGLKGNDIARHASDLRKRGYSIHFHTFTDESFSLLLYWLLSVVPIKVLEGPIADGIEFHVLVQKL